MDGMVAHELREDGGGRKRILITKVGGGGGEGAYVQAIINP